MNRNVLYNLFKEGGLKPFFNRKTRGYYVRFRFENEFTRTGDIKINEWYIRGFSEIALCTNEIVIISKYEDMKINIKYIHIKNVELYLDED